MAEQPGQPQQNEQQGFSLKGIFSSILQMLVIYAILNNIFKATGSYGPAKDKVTGQVIPNHECLFPRGQMMNLEAYFTNTENFDFNLQQTPVWSERDLFFDSRPSNNRKLQINVTKDFLGEFYDKLVNNQTVWMHVFITKDGFPIDPHHPDYDPTSVVHIVKTLNRYRKIKKSKTKNLLKPEENKEDDDEEERYGSFWSDQIYINIVDMHDSFRHGTIPPHIQPHMKLDAKNISYYPIIFFNEFWILNDKLILLNDTLKSIPLTVELSVISALKWQFYIQMDMSFDMQKKFGSIADEETDEFKRMLLETNPYLLGLTIVVSILHTIFDFLAFKNDIQFWKDKKDLEGLSIKTLFLNAFFQVVIFLYLLDNETSWLIIISSFVGLLIEFWKLTKAVTFKKKDTFPYFTFEDKESYKASKTKEYDEMAMRYLSYIIYPLIIIYAIYSLIYNEHKSWYSFILSTLVGFIYAFGFIMMTPQLFINYKLKSVAHLPWRAFVYKALNTFIDDLFAFIIKMPTLHRLSCFRDDIIFFIYLYQRWIYPVDKTRVNEFGQVGEEVDTQVQKVEETPETQQVSDDGKLKKE